MNFDLVVEEGRLIKRYKRFFADIHRQGQVITAHCPNTGSLKGLAEKNAPCLYSINNDPKRKLKYTLQMIKAPSSWVGVNTGIANQLAWEAWETKMFSHWQDYQCARKEVKISAKSRIDLVLWKNSSQADPKYKIDPHLFHEPEGPKFHFVEVKNVTLSLENCAQFPDAVTVRGQKHIDELMTLIKKGHTAELLFVVQRTDCQYFSPADDIDPEYGCLLREAHEMGLKISPYACDLSPRGVSIDPTKKLTLEL